jgi:hypothetical protein
MSRLAGAVLLGIAVGAVYTVSPLTAWCGVLAAIVLKLAGRGLPEAERRALTGLLAVALLARLLAVGATFIVNTPMHDDESVAMLNGDEAYGLSRAIRTRDVLTGAPVTQYDYFITYDEYGRNSYITTLSAIQILFGPTPYSMRLLNALVFVVAAILLFRLTRAAFGALPAFGGLAVLLFLPTLFTWSISLLKEPLYLLVTAVALTGVAGAVRGRSWQTRVLAMLGAVVSLVVARDLRPAAVPLMLAGLGTGVVAFLFFSSPLRVRLAAVAVAALVAVGVTMRSSVPERLGTALDTAAKTHTGHVFTVGHSYRLLDAGFYFVPVTPIQSTLSLAPGEAARYILRAAASFITVPWPWEFVSVREFVYLPEHVLWYVMVAFVPVGLVAGWRRNRFVTMLLAGYMLPTAAAIALTNGNVGTLVRLRGIVIPYVIWLSAVGFVAALQWTATSADRRVTA